MDYILEVLDALARTKLYNKRIRDIVYNDISNRNIEIENYIESVSDKSKEFMDYLKEWDNPYIYYMYSRDVIGGQWPEVESSIASDPIAAYNYAADIIQGPWPEGGSAIAKEAWTAYEYSVAVLKTRFLLGEKAILSDPDFSEYYKWKFKLKL